MAPIAIEHCTRHPTGDVVYSYRYVEVAKGTPPQLSLASDCCDVGGEMDGALVRYPDGGSDVERPPACTMEEACIPSISQERRNRGEHAAVPRPREVALLASLNDIQRVREKRANNATEH